MKHSNLYSTSAFCSIFAVLLILNSSLLANPIAAKFGNQDEFFFGLATAPAHVEDQLNDGWLRFAESGGVAAWHNQIEPEKRNLFWSQPEITLDLSAQTGVKFFRMGIDWARLVPEKPSFNPNDFSDSAYSGIQDHKAMERYKEIIGMIKDRDMKVMLTLFHHSLPVWAMDMGGWTNSKVKDYFLAFASHVVYELHDDVDYWVTFNEPAVFLGLSYIYKIWPSHIPEGEMPWVPYYIRGIRLVSEAHNTIYDLLHRLNPQSMVGIAKNYNQYRSIHDNFIGKGMAATLSWLMNNKFMDRVIEKSDYIGVNFYGEERVSLTGPAVSDDIEYSESGRAVTPWALYSVLKQVNKRYNIDFRARKKRNQIPFIITENGVADATDIIRPAYLIEHLMAVKAAQDEGVSVLGFVFWTISDNWEWADGYCPKFGLMSINRETMERIPRPSYYLFQDIVSNGEITETQREGALQLFQGNIGKDRPYCRAEDAASSLDEPRIIPIKNVDLEFSKT